MKMKVFILVIAFVVICCTSCESNKAREQRQAQEFWQQVPSAQTSNSDNINFKEEKKPEHIVNEHKAANSSSDIPQNSNNKIRTFDEIAISKGYNELVNKNKEHLSQMSNVSADTWMNVNIQNPKGSSNKR